MVGWTHNLTISYCFYYILLRTSLAPAAETAAAAQAGRFFVGIHGPALGPVLPAAARPRLADEAIAAGRGDMNDTLRIAQPQDAAIVAHQQIGRCRRPQQQGARNKRQAR